MTIFLRGSLYLSNRYTWVHIPHEFPEWQVPQVLELMTHWKDPADGMAEVSGKVIDLDTLEVIRL